MNHRSLDHAKPDAPSRQLTQRWRSRKNRPPHAANPTDVRNHGRLAYRDRFVSSPQGGTTGRQLSVKSYACVVLITGCLAVVQFFFLPRNLGAAEFGLAVLGLSITQAAVQFSDLGLINASLRSDVSDGLRSALRTNAVSISSVFCLASIVVFGLIGVVGVSFGYVAAAAFACAIFLIGGRAQASASVHMSDEPAATRHNVFWQNATKIGSVVGSFGGTAIATMLAAVATSAAFGRPHLPRRVRFAFLVEHRSLWLPGVAVSASAFLMTWVDTYVLSIVAGVKIAGDYQAIVRPLTGITYIYLPIIALIQAAFNARAHKRVKILMLSCFALGTVGSVSVAAFLISLGRHIWPLFTFDPPTVVAAAVAATAMCGAFILGGQLILLGCHTSAAVNTSIGAILLGAVSTYTVRDMGAFGAGLASAIAWTFVVFSHGAVLIRRTRTKQVCANQ